MVNDSVNRATLADKIGVVPIIINLEWIRKIHRDKASRGYLTEAVTGTSGDFRGGLDVDRLDAQAAKRQSAAE